MSRVRRDHPRCRSAPWTCTSGHTCDIVTYSKFHWNLFRGLWATVDLSRYFVYWLLQQLVGLLPYKLCEQCVLLVRWNRQEKLLRVSYLIHSLSVKGLYFATRKCIHLRRTYGVSVTDKSKQIRLEGQLLCRAQANKLPDSVDAGEPVK